MNDSRTLRIFVSSTFRDMQAERDLLVKRVFPEIRRLCAERSVTFTDVDLRWGITEEQAAEGRVLPICLEEIDRSRPFFIGLLGERYGYIAEHFPPEIVAREPWLQEHVNAGTSVTELEILHGVLRIPVMHGRSYFYFRDPAYLDHFSAATDRAAFESEGEAAGQKLVRLKARIRQAHETGVCKLLENYRDPEALAEAVRADLIELIDWRYPKEDVPDPLDREAQGHAAYAQSKRFAYVERPVHTAAIDAAVAGEGPPLVITGESGGGKTSLLASWAARWAETHPNAFVFEHYFGATPQSASVTTFLTRLFGELKRRYGFDDDDPIEDAKRRKEFPWWLNQTKGLGVVIIVLDGLDQIVGEETDRFLAFLPTSIPSHVRIVASALTGPALSAWRERRWTEHMLPLPDVAERNRMIDALLSMYGKTLSPHLRRTIIDSKGTETPLFLRTVLEELRQFGSFEALSARVAHYLEADTPEELFRRVLRRWQGDFDRDDDLVRRVMRVGWAAREGVAEAEWLEMLGQPGEPLPRQRWRPLLSAMEPHLTHRNGLYAFSHNFLKKAAELEFVAHADERREAHRVVAGYFERQPGMTLRKMEEWPWQLGQANEWDRLHKCLTDQGLFLWLYEQAPDQLLRYWLLIEPHYCLEESYGQRVEQWYEGASDQPISSDLARRAAEQTRLYGLTTVAKFCHLAGRYEVAEALFRRSLSACEKLNGPDHWQTLQVILMLAGLMASRANYAEAYALFRRALAWDETKQEVDRAATACTPHNVFGPEHPLTLSSFSAFAHLLHARGDFSTAEKLYQWILQARRRVLGVQHPSTLETACMLAGLLRDQGNYEEAESLCRPALDTQERMLGADHPSTLMSVSTLATIFEGRGDYTSAAALYRRAFGSYHRVLGPDHPVTLTSANALDRLLVLNEECGEAGISRTRAAIQESESADELEDRGLFDAALPLREAAVKKYAQEFGSMHPEVALALNNLAILLRKMGCPAQAEAHLRRAIEIERQTLPLDSPKHPHRLSNLSTVLIMQDKLDEARRLCGDAWILAAVRYDITNARLAFVRLTIALLEHDASACYLGHLKALLTAGTLEARGNVATTWEIDSYLESVRTRLTTPDADFLTALAAALNDRSKVSDLDRYPAWADQPLVPLEVAWPVA